MLDAKASARISPTTSINTMKKCFPFSNVVTLQMGLGVASWSQIRVSAKNAQTSPLGARSVSDYPISTFVGRIKCSTMCRSTVGLPTASWLSKVLTISLILRDQKVNRKMTNLAALPLNSRHPCRLYIDPQYLNWRGLSL